MKRIIIVLGLCAGMAILPTQKSSAQLDIIRQAIIAAIKAADIAVQKVQNHTIWLQEAQKEAENILSKIQLDGISDWTNKHLAQYVEYYNELKTVKEAIAGFEQVKGIIQKQIELVNEYKSAIALFKKDAHFSPKELEYMESVYSGIIDESIKNLDQLFLVVDRAVNTEMTDGKRLEIANGVSSRIDENLSDLRMFNYQNGKLSVQRSRDAIEVARLKALYGIQ